MGTDINLEREFAIADEGEEVNDMLIDAIKAKLAILDEMDKWIIKFYSIVISPKLDWL